MASLHLDTADVGCGVVTPTAVVIDLKAYRESSRQTQSSNGVVIAGAAAPAPLDSTTPGKKRAAPREKRSKLMPAVFLREYEHRKVWILRHVSLKGSHTNKTLGDAAIMGELDACMRAKEILEAIGDGRDPFAGDLTIGRYFDEVRMPWARANKRSWTDDLGVFNRYTRRKIGMLLMRTVKPHQLQALIDDLLSGKEAAQRREKLSEGTIYQVIALIKALFAWALQRGDISLNPAARLCQLKLNNHRRVVYTGSELQAIGVQLEFAPPLVRLLFVMLLALATRIGELLAATHDEVSEVTCTILLRQTKNGRTIRLPMPAAAMEAYQELKALRKPGNDHLFPAARGSGSMAPPRKAMKKVLEAAGVTERRTFHDVRRTAATEAIACPGVALIDVSRALNHSSVTVTEQRYLVTSDVRIRHALTQSSTRLHALLNFHKQCRANGGESHHALQPTVRSIHITRHQCYVFSGGVAMS